MDDHWSDAFMTDEAEEHPRGKSSSFMRTAECKDCLREVKPEDRKLDDVEFTYNEAWAAQQIDRGGSRSDRCPKHRQSHRKHIQGIAVAYVDLVTVGQAVGADDETTGPTGPLGGLGPLPGLHVEKKGTADLGAFGFGMDDNHIREMLSFLECDEQRILIVKAGTGTGKSTYMPYRLLDPPEECFRLSDLGPIVVTEPRIQATIGVAEFVGQQLSGAQGVGPGFPIGYQVSTDRNHDSACQLIYATDGTVVNWIREGRLSEIGTIIVDEAHERSLNIDFIMGFLKRNIERYPHLRVIITSATFNADFYVEYFLEQYGMREVPEGGRSPVKKMVIPAQKSIGYGFPLFPSLDAVEAGDDGVSAEDVTAGWERACGPGLRLAESLDEDEFISEHWTRYADAFESHDLTADRQSEVGEREDLHVTTRRLLPYRFTGPAIDKRQWQREMPKLVGAFVTRLVKGLEDEEIFGDVLAFLPTANAIEEACEILRYALGDDVDVFALLSKLPTEEKRDALEARRKGDRRKVVVSSNLAETSLTVEGVRFVVDSGLICQERWDVESANGTLPTVEHSQSGIKQRWGRVGRKEPGWVFPLYSKSQFVSLPEDTPPGSTRSNLESLVMTAKLGGIDEIADFPWPASFEPTIVELDQSAKDAQEVFKKELVRANEALMSAGALDRDGDPTSFGKELTRIQSLGSTASAMAIMYADRLGCVPEAATILALLEDRALRGVHGLLADGPDWPCEWKLEAAERHEALFSACEDEAEAVLQIVAAWERADPGAPPWENTPARAAFARSLWLNQTCLVEMAVKRRDVLGSLSPAMKEEVKRFVEPTLLRRARGAITRAMGALEYRRHGDSVFRPASGTQDGDAEISHEHRTPAAADANTAADRIIPLSRRRRSNKLCVSNIVTVEDWAVRPDGNDLGGAAEAMDLLVSASEHARPEADAHRNTLAALLREWPPGTRLKAGFDRLGEALLPDVTDRCPPAPLPEPVETGSTAPVDADEVEVADGDSDPETRWPAQNARIDDTEALERASILDTRHLEADASACGACEHCLVGKPQLCATVVRAPTGSEGALEVLSEWRQRSISGLDVRRPNVVVSGADPVDGTWYEVAGYDVTSDGEYSVILRPDWRKAGEAVEPGRHRDLGPGQSVELRVGELRSDLDNQVRVLYRADGSGRFTLSEAEGRPSEQQQSLQIGTSLARGYQGLTRELKEGSVIQGTVIPTKEPGCLTVTLLELLHQHLVLHGGPQGKRRTSGYSIQVPALVTGRPNKHGYLRASLAIEDSLSGIRHRISFHPRGKEVPDPGDAVQVVLQAERAELHLEGVRIDDAQRIADKGVPGIHLERDVDGADGTVGSSGDKLRSDGPVSAAICRELEAIGPERARDHWVAEVWAFFARSHHIHVKSQHPHSGPPDALMVDRPAELCAVGRDEEDAIAELPANSIVKGFVVSTDTSACTVNLTPSISIVADTTVHTQRMYEIGEPVLARVGDIRAWWGHVALSLEGAFGAEAPLPPWLESKMRSGRVRLERELGVWIDIDKQPPTVRVAAPSRDTLDSAVQKLAQHMKCYRVHVEIPQRKTGRVIGKGGSKIRAFRDRPGIIHCDFAGNRSEGEMGPLVVAADAVDPLEELLAELDALIFPPARHLPARRMRVPPGKNGYIIGTRGVQIRKLIDESGISAASPIEKGSPIWRVKGPTEESIRRFVELVKEIVPRCQLGDQFDDDRQRPKQLVRLHPATREPVSSIADLGAESIRFEPDSVDAADLGAASSRADSPFILRSLESSGSSNRSKLYRLA